jgi:cellulose synthase/poly-beta-1,6-N-acetylglucosamine synthase-like glycosyltransferase
MTVAAVLFWLSAGLLFYTHIGYPLLLAALNKAGISSALARAGRNRDGQALAPASGMPGETRAGSSESPAGRTGSQDIPSVSLIVPAYDEEGVIAAKVANALALDYPRERLQVIVASDGSGDATVERARAAGADLVLDLPPGGKVSALNAAVAQASGEILAFSDANSVWAPDALRKLIGPLVDPAVGYVCGQVRFLDPEGGNLEGAYWRYEMAVREMESALAGVSAGNGGFYAVRRDAYIPLAPSGSHDLSFPFQLAKRGLRSLYVPGARAEEKMVPTIEGEFARKRRMMVGLWDIVVGEGMLSPRGYPPLFALEIASHRLLRYLSPLLHLVALAANALLLGAGRLYILAFALQLALLGAALLGRSSSIAPFRVARYYVLTTTSIAAGLWDRMRRGAGGRWQKAAGTR